MADSSRDEKANQVAYKRYGNGVNETFQEIRTMNNTPNRPPSMCV